MLGPRTWLLIPIYSLWRISPFMSLEKGSLSWSFALSSNAVSIICSYFISWTEYFSINVCLYNSHVQQSIRNSLAKYFCTKFSTLRESNTKCPSHRQVQHGPMPQIEKTKSPNVLISQLWKTDDFQSLVRLWNMSISPQI